VVFLHDAPPSDSIAMGEGALASITATSSSTARMIESFGHAEAVLVHVLHQPML